MSGGSYDYLCHKESGELFEYSNEANLERMAQRLAGLGYAEDAARETEELLLLVRQSRMRLQVRMERLAGLWRAVEWWDSCDSGEDGVKHALDNYRERL